MHYETDNKGYITFSYIIAEHYKTNASQREVNEAYDFLERMTSWAKSK